MKKVLSAILTITMLMTCALSAFTTCVSAADEASVSSLEAIIEFLDDNMPESSAQRKEVYNILSNYLKTDAGIDVLIGALDAPEEAAGDIATILDALDIEAIKDDAISALKVLKAIDDSDVEDAIADFEAFVADTAENEGIEEEEIEAQDELIDLYEDFVGATAREKLASHNIGANAIVKLAKVFDGYVLLTDDVAGGSDFAVKELSDSFTSSDEDFIEAIVDDVNENYSTARKNRIKEVLGQIGLYEAKTIVVQPTQPTQRPESSGKDRIPGIILPATTPTTAPTEAPVYEEVNEALTISKPAEAPAAFADTQNHWAKDYVADLSGKGIFNGYSDGSFKPENGITREEIAVTLVRILGLESKLGTVALKNYTDVTEISAWARESVALITDLGIFKGYSDGYFRANRVVSREELCAVLVRAMENSGNKAVLKYNDRHAFAEWSKAYIGKASYLGIVQGYPDGEFKPTQQVTRAEAAKIIYNFLQIR